MNEIELITIPAGEFLIGSDPEKDGLAYDDEQPQHTLYLPKYQIARTPVTNARYAVFVQATGHRQPKRWEGGQPPRDKAEHPVLNISWDDALAYCRWLSEVTGESYGLPSEAEWEKAARGTDGRIYPWGDEWDTERCNTWDSGLRSTTPVVSYPQGVSPYGVLDMAGNAWEWTRSHYEPYPYIPDDGREELETTAHVSRVLRGGAFNYNWRYARCAYRSRLHPTNSIDDRGFRVVVAPGS